jgi:hypothetical protein
VRLGPSTPGDYVRARVLVPQNPGVTVGNVVMANAKLLSQFFILFYFLSLSILYLNMLFIFLNKEFLLAIQEFIFLMDNTYQFI